MDERAEARRTDENLGDAVKGSEKKICRKKNTPNQRFDGPECLVYRWARPSC